MRRHFSAEVLALHREGAVSARKAGRITAHLAVCAVCAGVDSDLAAVSSVLVSTQLPPMPDAFAERIQLAIAAEATARAAASAASGASASAVEARTLEADRVADADVAGAGAGRVAGDGVAGDGVEPSHIPGRPDLPEPGRRGRGGRGGARRFRMPDWSSPMLLRGLAAAGAVVIIAGAGLLLAQGNNNAQNGSAGSASSGRGSGSAHREAHAPSAQGPTVGGAKTGYSSSAGLVSLSYRLKGKIATARALTSNQNYTKRNLATLVHKDVASAAGVGTAVTPSTTQRPTAQKAVFGGIRVRTLVGCLTKVAAGRTVVVADIARYLGAPATIVVLNALHDAHVLDVVVVGVACSAASPNIVAELTVPAG